MNQSQPDDDRLAQDLSKLFAQTIQISGNRQHSIGELSVSSIDISYLRQDSSPLQTVRQTIVYLDDPELNFPEFAAWPHFKGIAGKVFALMGNMIDINFEDSPVFSDAYHLFAWNEAAVRKLFNREIRSFLGDHPGWSIRANGARIAIFKQDQTVATDRLDPFVNDAAEILRRFRDGEAQLGDDAKTRRESSLQDLLASADQMGGIQGRSIRRQVERLAISDDEIQRFLATPAPRLQIPTGLKRQVVGENLPLVLLGIVLIVAGIAVPALIALMFEGNDRLFAIPFAVLFPLIGAIVLSLALRHRTRKHRVLRDGILSTGTIGEVRRTNVEVNGAHRYHVFVNHSADGNEHSVRCNVYAGIEKAEAMQRSGQPIRLLIDPKDPNHVICIDILLITATASSFFGSHP